MAKPLKVEKEAPDSTLKKAKEGLLHNGNFGGATNIVFDGAKVGTLTKKLKAEADELTRAALSTEPLEDMEPVTGPDPGSNPETGDGANVRETGTGTT